tara:strand:- start:2389 stop:4971 length:2583 start_codon:yes stop_codon:yes gene_type:complete
MSSISILSGDWEILFDDEKNQNGGSNAVAGMRTVRHTGASTTVYTTNQLYSAVADASDDFIAMGFKNPMLPTTPNAYTMENQYFIPRSSTQYLKEGAITADWSLTGSNAGDGVLKVAYSGGTNFVSGDIGRQVTQGTTNHTGTLLDFDIDQDGTTVAWIRPDDPSSDTFSGTDAISVTSDGGTGASTSSTTGVSGEHIFAAIQAIGSVPTATEVYLIQDRQKVQSWDGTFQWWSTDATASLGIISILMHIKDSGTLISDGDVEVFARRYTSLYDNFRLNVSTGGFSALPLASSPDINNTTGYRTFTGSSGVSDFDVGNAIYVGATYATATKKGVITAVGGTTVAPEITYYLIGDLTDFTNTDSVKEYDFDTAADGDGTCTAGTPAAASGGPTDSSAGEGGTVTVSLGHVDVDHTGAGGTEPYSLQIDCQGDVPIAKVYERIKYITRRGATAADLFGSGTNVPGETYRGLDGFIEYTTSSGSMTDGDDLVTDPVGDGWSARLIAQSASTTPKYITTTDSQTSLDSISNGDVIDDESGDSITALSTGGGATYGILTFTSPKQSPFGTFTGTQIFGARGVNFTNFAAADVRNYILTDDNGTLRNPPNTVSFTVSNTVASDRVLVARDTGTSGVIDKDQFGGMTTTSAGDTSITVGGTVDAEVPQAGYLRVVDTSPALSRLGNTDTQQEHKYEYSSRTTGSGGVFTLTAVTNATGTATGGSTTTLVDSGASWSTGATPVKVGMLVRNTTDGGIFEVTEVTSDTTLTLVQVYGTAGGDFTSSDGYAINQAITAYTTDDNLYDLILDKEATTTSASNSFTKTLSADFGVVVNVRQGKTILPFTLNQTQGDSSTTVTVVRQPDNIAT